MMLWNKFLLGWVAGLMLCTAVGQDRGQDYAPATVFPNFSDEFDQLLAQDSITTALKQLESFAYSKIGSASDTALLLYHWLLDEAKTHDAPQLEESSLQALSTLYQLSGQHRQALRYAKAGLRFMTHAENAMVPELNYIGLAHFKLGQYDSAQFYFKQGYMLSKALDDSSRLGTPANNLGLLYLQIGEYEFAAQYFYEALEYYAASDQSLSRGTVLHNLGALFRKMGDLDKATNYLTEAKEFAVERDYGALHAKALYTLADVLVAREQTDSAAALLRQAAGHFQDAQNHPTYIEILRLEAQIRRQKNDLTGAMAILQKADAISKKMDDVSMQVALQISLAEVIAQSGNPKLAEATMISAAAEAEKHRLRALQEEIYIWLARHYVSVKNPERANSFFEKHTAVSDSLAREHQSRVIYEMETSREQMLMDQQISHLSRTQQEAVKKAALQRRLNLALLALLLGSIGFAAFMFIALRKNQVIADQQRVLLEQEIVVKDQETIMARMHALVEGEESERKRIAAELHDGLGAVLLGARMQVQAILPTENNNGGDLWNIEKLLGNAYDEVRRIAYDMVPAVLSQGLVAAIEQHCAFIQSAGALEVRLQLVGDPVDIGVARESMVYRMVQELVSNVVKHARASVAHVQISFLENEFAMSVEDNGQGFDTSRVKHNPGSGLENLRARVEHLQGRIEINSDPMSGTEIMISFPI